MSAATYQEPYKLPSGILALAVHAGFFALLYFGFTWQALPPATMSVELWQELPDEYAMHQEAVVPLPPPLPNIEEVIRPAEPVQPEKVVVPDIVLPEKKKPKPVEKKPEKKKNVEVVKPKPDTRTAERERAEKALTAQEQAARIKAEEEQAARVQALRDQAARERAEKEAATGKVVDEYKAKIMAKIRRNIVMPPNVPDEVRAEFSVTLLPGGSVLQARLIKTSGDRLYDSAVERAILKSDPLPLPPDVALFNKFRELKLIFQPTGQ